MSTTCCLYRSRFTAFPCFSRNSTRSFCSCARAASSPVLLVGDGRSDFCASGAADLVFAKGRLARHCHDQRLRHRPIDGFGDALALLPDLDSLLAAA